ncbi:MAG: cobyrinate a,c-diamide synthase [Pseudomonadota bacterium]
MTPPNVGRGLVLAAPASGSGKTTVTLGLLAALRARGVPVRGAKSGPDYIDPRFHSAASGVPCATLDAFAMGRDRLRTLAAGSGVLLVEGAMGLFDGAPPHGRGSTADVAKALGLPVVLVVDVARQAQSVAALVAGFAAHDPGVTLAGVILNRVGSPRHEAMLRAVLDLPVLGALLRDAELALPSRHLGWVQAEEHPDLSGFLDRAGRALGDAVDLDALLALAAPIAAPEGPARRLPPPAQRIAVARDAAFAFAYPHHLAEWRAQGAEIVPFSPLADDPPDPGADLTILPGGYPELYAGRLAANARFLAGLRAARAVYGECGGYMVMGAGLTDAGGARHAMAGLLGLETSFAQRKLSLGYRQLKPLGGPFAQPLLGHEFHYATTTRADGAALFRVRDGAGDALADAGLRTGPHAGSFAHVIDAA